METTTETNLPPVHYNPNQLVTYKVIDLDATDQTIHYPTVKVTDLEWQLETARRTEKQLASLRVSESNLEDMLPTWLENDADAAEIVSDICQIFGFNPTKEIEFEATVTIQGTVTVPLAEIADFDIDSIDLNVDASSYSHDVEISDVEVDRITTL